MIGKMHARILNAWTNGALRMHITTLLGDQSWRVALTLALMLFETVARGAQLLLLVPLMGLIGLDIQEESVAWLNELASSAFAVVGLSPTVLTVLGAYMILNVALGLMNRWQEIYTLKLEQDFVASMRQRLYWTIANTNWLDFSRRRSTDFAHALTDEMDRVGDATYDLLDILAKAVMMVAYVLIALQLSPTTTALAFGAGTVLLLLMRRKRQRATLAGGDISSSIGGLYAAAIEHLGGMKTVKSYGAERRSADLFSRMTDLVARMQLDATRNNSGAGFWFGVGSAFMLCVLIYISLEVLALPTAELLLSLFLFGQIVPLFDDIQESWQQYLNNLPAFAAVQKMLARYEASAEPQAKNPQEAKLQRGVRMEGVYFAYAKESSLALLKLDLTIEAGKTTAIVGPSGAGKSTIADLIMGLISATRGDVLVDETPLDADQMRSWRDQIGYVAQDTFLFNDTVRANLLWARPDADEEEIEQSLSLSAATGFVSALPDGLETVLGDRGVRLSGGEQQRLALARALLREPSLLILDEATSALDSENEKRIQSAVEELRGRMTILIITHRLPTVREADTIYVLEGGTVVEHGDWDALLGKVGGRFNTLCRAQGIVKSQIASPD